MTGKQVPARPSLLLVQKYPYAFSVFLIGYFVLSITIGVIGHSIMSFGLMLIFTLPFALLATVFWALAKAFIRMVVFEL